jgi:hypothetical protein
VAYRGAARSIPDTQVHWRSQLFLLQKELIMTCILCDEPTEEEVVAFECEGLAFTAPVCDDCLIDAQDDSFLLTSYVHARKDVGASTVTKLAS